MPIDWNEFQKTIDEEIGAAATRTSKRLASRASSITRFTDKEIAELFPTPADVQRLKNLMEIVQSSADQNEKVNRLINNIEDLAGVAITLLEKFA